MRYLMSVSIGPVQDFIAASRKTRDLWFGSELLCQLCREAAKALNAGDSQLVFPPERCVGDQSSSVANKLLVLVETESPADLAESARTAAQTVLTQYWTDISAKHKGIIPKDRITLGQNQIDEFLEFYAAWWPCESDLDYAEVRLEVERLLAGRKALRDFRPTNGLAGVPKSSLDGGREAVIEAREGVADLDRLSKLGIKCGELLDAISLIKRLGETKRFVSVSRVAADPFIRKLGPASLNELGEAAKKLEGTDAVHRFDVSNDFPQYKAFPCDTQLFFSQIVDDEVLDSAEKKAAADFADALSSARERDKLREPYPYFAVLAADGDRMGATIGDLKSPKLHIELSENLDKFASAAKRIVQDNSGVMIYCGGDDVLALLPIDTAIGCSQMLRDAFQQHVGDFAGQHKTDHNPTLSCGISIAHFGASLQELLKWARDAEKAAKTSGRNRLAVHLHTRTAGEESVDSVRQWGTVASMTLLEYWNRLVELQAEDRIPDGAIYELRTLAREFNFEGADTDILAKEVQRVMGRKRTQGGTKPIDETVITELAEMAGRSAENLEDFVKELLIARRIAAAKPQKEVK